MIVDSSAIVAIILQEPGYQSLLSKLIETEPVGIGAPTLAETVVVLSARLGRSAQALVEELLRAAEIEVLPFGADHWREAHDAYLRYGRGRHPAALNFGDCLAYATARVAGQPLLYKGEDFSQTDLAAI